MKRTHSYEINMLQKTVTVTRKFMENATQLNSNEFELLSRFEEMGLKIIVQNRKKAKMLEGKLPLLTYQMMEAYIAMLDDAEEMMQEFKALKTASAKRPDRVVHVNKWFRSQFPNYDAVPEFDNEFRIVHNPNPIAA